MKPKLQFSDAILQMCQNDSRVDTDTPTGRAEYLKRASPHDHDAMANLWSALELLACGALEPTLYPHTAEELQIANRAMTITKRILNSNSNGVSAKFAGAIGKARRDR